MFSFSCLYVMATGLLCNSMLPVVSFMYFVFVNIYENKKNFFADFLLRYKINQRGNRVTNIIPIVQTLICKQYYNSIVQKFKVLVKLEHCITYKLYLNLSNSEPQYSYMLYFYKKCGTRHSSTSLPNISLKYL